MLENVPAGDLYESARWLDKEQCFQWVEIFSGSIYRWYPEVDKVEIRVTGLRMLSLALPWREGLLLAAQHSIFSYSWLRGEAKELARLDLPANVRFNDGSVGRDGRLYIGTMSNMGVGRLGALYRFDSEFRQEALFLDVGISNGIAWLTDDMFAYVDSSYSRIDTVTLGVGGEGVRRSVFASLPPSGKPDGLCFNSSHGLFVAMWDAGLLYKFRGGMASSVTTPFLRPTSVAISTHRNPIILVTSAKRDEANSEFDGLVAFSRLDGMKFEEVFSGDFAVC